MRGLGGGGGGGSVETLHDVRRLIGAFVGCKFDKTLVQILLVLAGSKMDDCIIVGKREKKMFVFYILLFLFYLTR